MQLVRRAYPTLRERIAFAVQSLCDTMLRVSCATYPTFLAAFKLLPPSYLTWASAVKARMTYYRAARDVPAYAAYLETSAGARLQRIEAARTI